jgi:hypothetical protein
MMRCSMQVAWLDLALAYRYLVPVGEAQMVRVLAWAAALSEESVEE